MSLGDNFGIGIAQKFEFDVPVLMPASAGEVSAMRSELRTRRTPTQYDYSAMPTTSTKRIGRRPRKGKGGRVWTLTAQTRTTILGVGAAMVITFSAALLLTIAVVAGYKTYFRLLINMARRVLVDDVMDLLRWALKG